MSNTPTSHLYIQLLQPPYTCICSLTCTQAVYNWGSSSNILLPKYTNIFVTDLTWRKD